MKRLAGIAVVAAVFASAAPAVAQGGWTLLGERHVNDRAERDVIGIGGARRFAQIRVCVVDRAVRFYDVDVRFRNGGNQDVPVRAIIPAGGCTREIGLRGRGRDIAEIRFAYEARTIGRDGAHIRVFGR